ncbi:hypothetical protein EZV62_008746 [Acer yangbiense]|uniref:Uncharacterized protein n=1 Tax=Acer yangbiense TaxID=1000413 RepID=A0A5C7IE98_9ROSI|nr:hypothetical protein EZV62_008746 [Acer yangbiense]
MEMRVIFDWPSLTAFRWRLLKVFNPNIPNSSSGVARNELNPIFPTEELVKEVENSVAEFKRHKQEYDEDRVKEQVQEILEGAKVLEWLREHAEIQYITR